MSLRAPWARRLAPLALAAAAIVGCTSAPRSPDDAAPARMDDFGTELSEEPITVDSISRTEMFHQRAQLEVLGFGAIPVPIVKSNKIEAGFGLGLKGDIEITKNAYLGLSFDWTRNDVESAIGPGSVNPDVLPNIAPEQFFKSIDRYNLVATFDYDFPLSRSFLIEKAPLSFRVGAGAGVSIVDPEADPLLQEKYELAGSSFKAVPMVAPVIRPAMSLRWQFWDHGLLSLGIGYDLVLGYRVDVRIGGQRFGLRDDIDFSAFTIGGAIALQF